MHYGSFMKRKMEAGGTESIFQEILTKPPKSEDRNEWPCLRDSEHSNWGEPKTRILRNSPNGIKKTERKSDYYTQGISRNIMKKFLIRNPAGKKTVQWHTPNDDRKKRKYSPTKGLSKVSFRKWRRGVDFQGQSWGSSALDLIYKKCFLFADWQSQHSVGVLRKGHPGLQQKQQVRAALRLYSWHSEAQAGGALWVKAPRAT